MAKDPGGITKPVNWKGGGGFRCCRLAPSLLVLCTAFRGRDDYDANLTVKKIPQQVLSRCEWGHDDYNLKVENLPQKPAKPGQLSLFGLKGKKRWKSKHRANLPMRSSVTSSA